MKLKALIILTSCLLLLTACNKINLKNSFTAQEKEEIQMSNMNSEKTLSFVKDSLKGIIKDENAEKFIDLVRDYNDSISTNLLSSDFSNNLHPDYDIGKIIKKRDKINHKYLNTNCRINTFLLLKDSISLKKDVDIDDSILFMDTDIIEKLKLFNADETKKFKQLFSRVKTIKSKNPKKHAKVMSDFLSNFNFPKNSKMISVVIHDNLDGDYLFIGHVGVLLPIEKGYLFLEKISFEEPYQAIKFPDKKSCYKYLKEKFKDYKDPNVAEPFIMENDEYVNI
ncbi:DUF4300 family protein [Peptoniphilus gorbachii]|uniref:DUF4300 domain-containing protein n=1 Tax=Peptoniphilus gorbachii TaxID=411567 RepID=A0ABS2MKT5_9FIRM|nr:DUF4300 family protein [Peptoniphilus gorbachii]MBM7550627.1 hypothetical protein [Peptoniphilus gorbachii]